MNNTMIIVVVIVIIISVVIGVISGYKKKNKEEQRIEDTRRRDKADADERKKIEHEEKNRLEQEDNDKLEEDEVGEENNVALSNNDQSGLSINSGQVPPGTLQPNYGAVYPLGIKQIQSYKGVTTAPISVIVGVDNTMIPFKMSSCVVSEFEPYITNYTCGNPNMTVVLPARPSIMRDGSNYILKDDDVRIQTSTQSYNGILRNNTYYFDIDITKLDYSARDPEGRPSIPLVLPLQIDNDGYTVYSSNCDVTEATYIALMNNINIIMRGTQFSVRYHYSENPRIYIDHVNVDFGSNFISLINTFNDKMIHLTVTKSGNNVHVLSTIPTIYDTSYEGTYIVDMKPYWNEFMNGRSHVSYLYNDLFHCGIDKTLLNKAVFTLNNDNNSITLNIVILKLDGLLSIPPSVKDITSVSVPAYTTLFNYSII